MEVIKGRMYDYNNGRFLSVDPFIQNPTSTQSMNPYTYIFNNPLSGIDPTGYISHNNGPCGILEANCSPGTPGRNGEPTGNRSFATDSGQGNDDGEPVQGGGNGNISNLGSEEEKFRNNLLRNENGVTSQDYLKNIHGAGKEEFRKGGEILEELNPLSLENLILGGVFKAAKIGRKLLKADDVPGRVKSRINLMNGSVEDGVGFEHVVARHFDESINASQFIIPQSELKVLLQSRNVVNTPISRVLESKDGLRFLREVDTGKVIGLDKFTSFQNTKVMTVLTDQSGNLITVTPGRITSPGINVVN